MSGDGSVIETGIDRLLAHVKRNGPVALSTAADELGVDEETAERWASSLEDANLLEIRHSARKGRVLNLADVEEADERLEEVREETEERVGRLAELSSGEEDLEQFQEVLERLKERLREREDDALELAEVLGSEHREGLDRYRENLIESEIEVEELERELDAVIAGINVLEMMGEEVGYDVAEEENEGLLARVKALVPGIGGTADSYTCTECGKSFDSQHGVEVHRGLVHSE
ncbi:MAG: hypothetical protein SVW02_01685 [Candidatus Nanohaloarchaea archaeon]|nr:hypothetical protein [Candidatus Nanohaloarchaea archaeon]